MPDNFDQILDNCIDRSLRGERLEEILADYQEYADRLRPLLTTMINTDNAVSFIPSMEAKRAGRQSLLAAIEKSRRSSLFERIFARRLAWATMAVVFALLVIGGYFGLRNLFPSTNPPIAQPTGSPTQTAIAQTTPTQTSTPVVTDTPTVTSTPDNIPVEYVASANPEGNFIFLVSDEVNAIAEFSNLNVTVEKIALLQSGDSEKWVEFSPTDNQFDLVQLPGEKTEQLWQGDLPDGKYIKARLYITKVTGTLKSDDSTIEIKLPSNKLDLDLPAAFNVDANSITSFTYDLTVINTGNSQDGNKYLLKPQANESGAKQQPKPSKDTDKDGKSKGETNTAIPTPTDNNVKKSNGKKNPDPDDTNTANPVIDNNEKK